MNVAHSAGIQSDITILGSEISGQQGTHLMAEDSIFIRTARTNPPRTQQQ
ncbi:hypothetical protein ACIWO4_08860 [Avibacterium paragallinarum]